MYTPRGTKGGRSGWETPYDRRVTSRTRFVIYLVLALAFVLLSAANAAQRRAVPAVAYTLCAAVLAALAARARPRP